MDDYKFDSKDEHKVTALEDNSTNNINFVYSWIENALFIIEKTPRDNIDNLNCVESAYKSLDSSYKFIESTKISNFIDETILNQLFQDLISENSIIAQGASILLRSYAKDQSKLLLDFSQNDVFQNLLQILIDNHNKTILANITSVIIECLCRKALISQEMIQNYKDLLFNSIKSLITNASDYNDSNTSNILYLRALLLLYTYIKNYNIDESICVQLHALLQEFNEIWINLENEDAMKFYFWTYFDLIHSNQELELNDQFYSILIKWMNIYNSDCLNLVVYLLNLNKFPQIDDTDFALQQLCKTKDSQQFLLLLDLEEALFEQNPFNLDYFFNKDRSFPVLINGNAEMLSFACLQRLSLFYANICLMSEYTEQLFISGSFNIFKRTFDPDSSYCELIIKAILKFLYNETIRKSILRDLENDASLIEDIQTCAESENKEISEISEFFINEYERIKDESSQS
ncbi:hypothetical protein TVAG_463330 [Trichomonas vaginalis G3]|uniref:Uncharacterized protein n=1 Tax=Trichomonas vaginalis (strain ATCC PRA-98 / G3) TaxID=412133 RepID=A2EH05_TRIV3|nr:hypothetical protein TVAGG3_0077960 [Trichomonas vaginalis G3]EAY08053.1 hypothetical protein TVAG_463330 [Trichomonas vaginalis G3]KAI5543030.1 hypothetical protein TVAGG3_0077960 [Trichomonas vaginalis G3]|eukprot:XP_001320276.1 hypothetical protein [Trichomonas vaginalis G3]